MSALAPLIALSGHEAHLLVSRYSDDRGILKFVERVPKSWISRVVDEKRELSKFRVLESSQTLPDLETPKSTSLACRHFPRERRDEGE